MVPVDILPPPARPPSSLMADSGARNAISTIVNVFSCCDSLHPGIDCMPESSRACSVCRERCTSATKDCCLSGNCCVVDHLKRLNQFLGGSWLPNLNFLLDCIIHMKAAETAAAIGREITRHGFCSSLPSSCKYQDGGDSDRENLILYKGTAKNSSITGQYKSIPETDEICSLHKDCAFPSDLVPEHHTKQQLDLCEPVGGDHITSSINVSPQGRGNLSEISEIGLIVHPTKGQNREERPLGDKDDTHAPNTVSFDDRNDLSDLACPSSTDITHWRKSDSNEVITYYTTQLPSLDTHHRSSGDKGNSYALNTDALDKQQDLYDVPRPSSIDISQWKNSDLNEVTGKTELPVNHTNDTIDENQAELALDNEDVLFVSQSFAKPNRLYNLRRRADRTGKRLPKKPQNIDPTLKKRQLESDAANQKESSILLLDDDYETYLEQHSVNGVFHVMASETFPDCSSVSANEDVDLKDKDYDLFLKHVRPHGHSYILEMIDPEQRAILVKYEEDCSVTKNIKKRKQPVKAAATKKTAVNGSSKRNLSVVKKEIDVKKSVSDISSKRSKVTNKNCPECPSNARESPGFGKSVSSHVHTLSEKSHLCNSLQPTLTITNTDFGNITKNFSCVKSDSFVRSLQDLLTKPYNNLEHEELMKEVTCRKPVYKERQLRGTSKPYMTQVTGLSYLDYYPDFQNRLESTDGVEQLELLRGFFFWLHNSCHDDSFKPWTSKKQRVQPMEHAVVEP